MLKNTLVFGSESGLSENSLEFIGNSLALKRQVLENKLG